MADRIARSAGIEMQIPFTSAYVAKDGGPTSLMEVVPPYRLYIDDLGPKNYYYTKRGTGDATKAWVIYEVTGVTMDDSSIGNVDLTVSVSHDEVSIAKKEILRFLVFEMKPNPVRLGGAMEFQNFLSHHHNQWLYLKARDMLGEAGYKTFYDRLIEPGANVRALFVREYELHVDPETGKPVDGRLEFLINFHKPDNFVPLTVKVDVTTNKEDLDRLFDRAEDGSYSHRAHETDPWYKRYKPVLILMLIIGSFVALRAVVGRTR
ncbi:hypothetical protein [Hydrogenophaga sp. 5NK40-0174]|uniref:hypothetical protein n=1 Tax=Hydrogenophaga sp. 5NK40-0174 TaxID=3127649 RepID=UPI00334010C8